MLDPITQQILNEGYLLSDKTISVNLSDFESGEKNKLLIVGTAGSGKTTLGEKLAKTYKVKWISIDSLWWRLKEKYYKGAKPKEVREKVRKKIIEEVIKYLKSNERLIIEGIDLLEIYKWLPKYRKLILNQTMIILGLSSLRAGIRAGHRNRKREGGEGWRELYWMAEMNMRRIEPLLKMLRNDIMKLPNVKIEKYEIKELI